MGSDSASGGTRLGSVPVTSAGLGALGCGAGAEAGAGADAAAGVDTASGAGPAADVVDVGVGAESGVAVIEAGASDCACGNAACGDGAASRFGVTWAAGPESCGLFDDGSALSDGAVGAGIDACPVEGATARELVSGCAGSGNGWSVTAGASMATRSP
jgi:hypothetical protein